MTLRTCLVRVYSALFVLQLISTALACDVDLKIIAEQNIIKHLPLDQRNSYALPTDIVPPSSASMQTPIDDVSIPQKPGIFLSKHAKDLYQRYRTLEPGSNLRLRVASYSECYVVVFWKTSEGKVFNLSKGRKVLSLFGIDARPNRPVQPVGQGLALSPGDIHIFPDNGWYHLGPPAGTETIILATSPSPIKNIAELTTFLASNTLDESSSIAEFKGSLIKWNYINHMTSFEGQQQAVQDIRGSAKSSFKKLDLDKASTSSTIAIPRNTSQELFDKIAPSVVHIYTDKGTGTGVIVDDVGLIVTNHHVVGTNKSVAISLKTDLGSSIKLQRIYVADVIKLAIKHDLALLRLRDVPNLLPVMKLGNSKDVKLGINVHAIGHPRGLLWSYTKGIVSQIRHDYIWDKHVANVIQTQTPINPGNSGGPLFMDSGYLVGINTAGFTDAVGLNIAVSVKHVKELLVITKTKKPKKGFLPVSIRTTAKESFDYFTKNGIHDLFCYDTDKNDKLDLCAVDKDEDGKADYWLLDQNENRKWDGAIHKSTDSKFGYIFSFDYDEDGNPDITGYDIDSDGRVDHITKYRQN